VCSKSFFVSFSIACEWPYDGNQPGDFERVPQANTPVPIQTENVTAMCCRIDRILTDQNLVILTVAGRIREEQIETLRTLLEQEATTPILDLQDVILIDREAVVFLASIEAKGCELRNCPPYIREWVTRERRGAKGRGSPEVPRWV
jgi:hypothetical protein